MIGISLIFAPAAAIYFFVNARRRHRCAIVWAIVGSLAYLIPSMSVAILASRLLQDAVELGLIRGSSIAYGMVVFGASISATAAGVLVAEAILRGEISPERATYRFILTYRYLRRKLIPLFALAAVTLCVAMLIIVISIMGGFHALLLNAGTRLMGDVKMYQGVEGFAHYEELIDKIESLPEAQAAAAMIETWGLLKTPSGGTRVVEVVGARPRDIDRVTRYAETIYWDKDRTAEYHIDDLLGGADLKQAAMDLRHPWVQNKGKPAMVMGLEINPYNTRTEDGTYAHPSSWLGLAMPLTVVPLSSAGGLLEPEIEQFVVINEFHSGLYDVDSKRIYVPFDVLQRMLKMQQATMVDPDDPLKVIGESPAKTSAVVIRAAEGVSAEQLRDAVAKLYREFRNDYGQELMPEPYMSISTWRQLLRKLLDTVENEKNLLTVLFGIVSAVSVIMVLVIFYMIVMEKTRDIGILRALGASRTGVASIFLLYAAVIGLIGAALGSVIAILVVTYINELHDWLGRNFDIVIWDKTVYFFDRIPNKLDPVEVSVIVIAAVIAAVIGAAVPAIKASRVDPVESLRYE